MGQQRDGYLQPGAADGHGQRRYIRYRRNLKRGNGFGLALGGPEVQHEAVAASKVCARLAAFFDQSSGNWPLIIWTVTR
ncbi:MAG TPA: hypothetical protein VF062_11855 [Candidatus Limnocylindrales bacterium]